MRTNHGTKERLAKALKEAGAPQSMVDRALAGRYDDFESDSLTPIRDLVFECSQLDCLKDVARRAMDGEFDGTPEEANAWMEREGEDLL